MSRRPGSDRTRLACPRYRVEERTPHPDGIALATVLAPHTPPIPIILMSAPLPYGCAQPFIRKPFDLEALLTIIARTLPICAVVTVALTGLGPSESRVARSMRCSLTSASLMGSQPPHGLPPSIRPNRQCSTLQPPSTPLPGAS